MTRPTAIFDSEDGVRGRRHTRDLIPEEFGGFYM